MAKVYIDGQAGTTGLEIFSRIQSRDDLTLLRIDEKKRHDREARRAFINEADICFLCLPDDAAREAVSLVESDTVTVIDCSTAHRTDAAWTYGFPELNEGQREAIRTSRRIANPGCHATGFISCTAPLVQHGLLPKDYPLTCFSLTGYSGGGKRMIADYEQAGRAEALSSPGIYGLSLTHKHLPEMQKMAGLEVAPVFLPVVDDYYKGMATSIMLHNELLRKVTDARDVHACLEAHYAGQKLVKVEPFCESQPTLFANRFAGTNELHIFVVGNAERTSVIAMFDNLGKGASGAAIQNMNIALGLDETRGLI